MDEYLGRCKKASDEHDAQAQELLTNEIICTFGAEIPKITASLSAEIVGDEVCYIPNIPQLEARLRNYQAYLVDENKKAEREIEKLKLQSLIINNTNQNISVASSSVSLSVTFEQTIERIHELPETELSEEDKEWFEEQLSALSLSKSKKDRGTFWNKAKPILAKAADKGFELAKIALPFLLKLMTEIPDPSNLKELNIIRVSAYTSFERAQLTIIYFLQNTHSCASFPFRKSKSAKQSRRP